FQALSSRFRFARQTGSRSASGEFLEKLSGLRGRHVLQHLDSAQDAKPFTGGYTAFQLGQQTLQAAARLGGRRFVQRLAQLWFGQITQLLEFLTGFVSHRKLLAIEIAKKRSDALWIGRLNRLDVLFEKIHRRLRGRRQSPNRLISLARVAPR